MSDTLNGCEFCSSFFARLQSVRSELIEKEERDTTGLESLLERDQEGYFLSTMADKPGGK